MASYVHKTLIAGEHVLYETKISQWTQLPMVLLGVILLPVFGVGLICWIIAYVRYKTTEMAVTNKRVVAKFGFIGRRTIEMNLSKVVTIEVSQGILGRIFGFGSLIVSGSGVTQEPVPGVENPMEFRRQVMEAQDCLQSRA